MTDRAQPRTGLESNLVRNISEAEYLLISLGALLRCAQYGLVYCLAHHRKVTGCDGGCALFVRTVEFDQVVVRARYLSASLG